MNFPWVVKKCMGLQKICTRALSSECHHTMMHIGPSLPIVPVKLEIELQTEDPLNKGTNGTPGGSRAI